MTYEQFLDGLQLRHFSGKEIIAAHGRVRGNVQNSLPPSELWANIVPTLWVVDHLRAKLGKPIILTSIYRSPEYNKAVGGEKQSYHMRNMAIDLQCDGARPGEVYKALEEFRAAGMFNGGLGLYENFVHVDTRGISATW